MTKVLVVGSAGYVGQRLMRVLKTRPGVEAVGADIRTGPGLADLRLDLAFPAQSFGLVHQVKPDVLIELAYMLSAPIEADPQRGIETNIVGINGLFEASVKLGVPRVLFASSGSVYGAQSIYGDREVDETEPLPPARTLYQLHKQFSERMIEHYNSTQKTTRFVILRISSPHGRGKQSSDFNPLDRLVQAVVAGQKSIAVPWTKDRPVSFNHVDDCAEICATLALAPSPRWDVYNLGGEALSTEQLARIASDKFGLEVKHKEGSAPATFMGKISSKRLDDEFKFRRGSAAEWFAREVAEAKGGAA